MRIAVDVMGSDKGPAAVVAGALDAAKRVSGLFPILVGDQETIEAECKAAGAAADSYEIKHSSQIVAMDESPIEAIRNKPESSLLKAIELVRDGEADAIVSAGSTGAQVAASQLILKLLPGVKRAGIATILPTRTGHVIVLDVGANVSAKAMHLVQYGVMGSLFAKVELGIETPRVGLLSVGSERTKGNPLVKETHDLLSDSPLNFIGNCEGHDVFDGVADVVVCDGFIGNVLLKIAEGLSEALFDIIKSEAVANGIAENPEFQKTFGAVFKRVDWQEVGGAQLLGVNGVSVIAHGRSDAATISTAVRTAHKLVETKLNDHIVTAFEDAVTPAAS